MLERHFGAGRVFLDVRGLEGGQHWLHSLEAQVDAAAAMVSLIPKGWADLRDETGARRSRGDSFLPGVHLSVQGCS